MSHGAELVGILEQHIRHGSPDEQERALLDAEEAYDENLITGNSLFLLTRLFMEQTGDTFRINH